jgi:acetyl/propionyl-CoA carboxylase alpha subunit
MSIRKLLVANRGEIAVRVMQTCREMGIRSVAVYSEADADSLHTRFADEALGIGEAEAAKSYLDMDAILSAARTTGADAVHPGYGFLSERPEFAEACQDQGIAFVGPPASAMRALGDKISAKNLAVQAGVPVVPGFYEPGARLSDLGAAAESVGYPVMLKASAGGGGRGMRVVTDPSGLEEAYRIASDEATRAFGNGSMMLEKLIGSPRHIEVQVLADRAGNVACLLERECSIQRRHQKLIEEAPSPFVQERAELWPALRDAAATMTRAAGYSNAGTVEFIVDGSSGEFYFLEVNARLQVEHPVTEAITGFDLVRLQICIAEGQELTGLRSFERSSICGHAIEARVIAEDPRNGFRPSVGRIVGWVEPKLPGVRVDSGCAVGSEVSRHYDSLLAKVVAHGATREDAIARLRRALEEFHVLGVQTNIAYLLDVTAHREFASAKLDTGFLERHFRDWSSGPIPPEIDRITERASVPRPGGTAPKIERLPAWSKMDGFRNALLQ